MRRRVLATKTKLSFDPFGGFVSQWTSVSPVCRKTTASQKKNPARTYSQSTSGDKGSANLLLPEHQGRPSKVQSQVQAVDSKTSVGQVADRGEGVGAGAESDKVGGIANSDVECGPGGGKHTSRRGPGRLLQRAVKVMDSTVGRDGGEEASDEGQSYSEDGVACQVCVETLAHLMTVVKWHFGDSWELEKREGGWLMSVEEKKEKERQEQEEKKGKKARRKKSGYNRE